MFRNFDVILEAWYFCFAHVRVGHRPTLPPPTLVSAVRKASLDRERTCHGIPPVDYHGSILERRFDAESSLRYFGRGACQTPRIFAPWVARHLSGPYLLVAQHQYFSRSPVGSRVRNLPPGFSGPGGRWPSPIHYVSITAFGESRPVQVPSCSTYCETSGDSRGIWSRIAGLSKTSGCGIK